MLVMVSEEIFFGRVLCFPLPSLGDVPLLFNDFCIVSIRLLLTPCIDTNALILEFLLATPSYANFLLEVRVT